MNNLVCPGFAKSGTTLLHFLFMNSPDFVGPAKGKEQNWFLDPAPKGRYQELFPAAEDETTIFFEFSPVYLSTRRREILTDVATRMKSELPDAKVLLAIRHPLYRAISHYVHQIQSFARFGMMGWSLESRNLGHPYFATFEQAIEVDPVVRSDMAESVKTYLDIFGQKNCHFFFLETDTKDFPRFAAEVRAAFGLDDDGFWVDRNVPHVLAQNQMPQYFSGGKDAMELNAGGRRFVLPAGSLYIASELGHEIVTGLDPLTIRGLLGAQRSWTTEFPTEVLERLNQEILADEISQLCDVIDGAPHGARLPAYREMAIKPKKIERVEPDAEFLMDKLSEPA